MYIIRLPEDMANYLVERQVARRRKPPRAGFFELFLPGVEVASVCISLLQAPAVYSYYAEAIRNHVRDSRQDSVLFEMRGPRGTVKLTDVGPDDDISELAGRLRDILE